MSDFLAYTQYMLVGFPVDFPYAILKVHKVKNVSVNFRYKASGFHHFQLE